MGCWIEGKEGYGVDRECGFLDDLMDMMFLWTIVFTLNSSLSAVLGIAAELDFSMV